MPSLKMIKSDAQVNITFGTNFIGKLQSLLLYLTEDRSVEELKMITEHIQKNEELPEQWMEHIQTIVTLLREIENAAVQQNQVNDIDVDDVTKQ